MYLRTFPKQTFNSDLTFFDGGFRLSDDFIKRENLQDQKSIWIFVDKDVKKIGFEFHLGIASQSIPLTNSSKSTSGKTVWCAYLKGLDFINDVMKEKDIKDRRFQISRVSKVSSKGESIKFEVNLRDNIRF